MTRWVVKVMFLLGGDGDDTLLGGDGDFDHLQGGAGNDVLDVRFGRSVPDAIRAERLYRRGVVASLSISILARRKMVRVARIT